MSPPKANAKHTQPGTCAAAKLNQTKSKPRQADSAQAPERSQAAGRLANDELNALLQCTHGDPFAVLGMHAVEGSIVVRALLPSALEVELIDAAGRQLGTLARQDDSALFTALIPRQRQPFAYRLRVLNGSNARIYKLQWSDGTPLTILGVDGGLLHDFAVGIRAALLASVPQWQPIEHDQVEAGMRIRATIPHEERTSIYIGVAHHWGRDSDWCTEGGWLLTGWDAPAIYEVDPATIPDPDAELIEKIAKAVRESEATA